MDKRRRIEQVRQELERLMTLLVESTSAELEHKDKEILIDFIENYEYGVALEWLYSIVVERSIQLTLPQQQEIQRLAQRMGIDLSQFENK